MPKDVSETIRHALTNVAQEAVKSLGDATPTKKKSRFSGASGVAAGAGLAAMVPIAKKGFDAVRGNGVPTPAKATGKLASKAGDRVGSKLKDAVSSKVDEAGGAGGMVKDAASGLLPFGGGGGNGDDDGKKDGMPGVGKGRRMPIQQAVDVAVPVEVAYNQWTQYEDWPNFMHRVTRVTQDDPTTVKFATKIWGKTKEFTADIETQRPDERIVWRVSEGITHAGVVTFHELAPRLTRIELDLDVQPGSLLEKAARGMRHIKRAVRADLARFKAFIEMQEKETGAWRGVIEDGEVAEEHPESYDDKRDYAELEDIYELGSDEDEDEGEDEDKAEEDESQKSRAQRFKRQAEKSRSGSGSSSRSRGGSSSSGGGSSSSRRGSKSSSSRGSGSGARKSSSSSGGSSSSRGRTAATSRSSSSRSTSGGSRKSSSSNGSGSSKGSSKSATKKTTTRKS